MIARFAASPSTSGGRIGVTCGAGNAEIHVLFLQRRHHVAVLGMDEGQRAQIGAALEGREHLVILDHQRALVGHEVLERVHPALNDPLHLVEDAFVPAGNRHVIREIGAALRSRLRVPRVDGIEKRAVLPRQHEIDDHRRAPGGGGEGAGLERLGGGGAHEGHFEMRMRVDAAGDDVGFRRIDRLVALQIRADLDDLAVVDEDIGGMAAVGGDDGAALDDFGHGRCPFGFPAPGLTRGLLALRGTGHGRYNGI